MTLIYTSMIKEISTYTGGQPVYTKDLAFLQEAFKEAITCMNKSIGDTYILYGSLSGSTVIEGAVVINGDVYKVTALGEIGNNKLCFRKKETSERTFRNSEKHKVYVDYEAYLSTDTSGAVAWIDLKTASRADARVTELEEDVLTLKKKTQPYTELIDGSSSSLNDIIAKLKEYKSVRVNNMTNLITNSLAKNMYNNGQWQGMATDIEFVLEIVSETDQKYIVIATANDNTVYKGVGTMSIAKSGETAYLYGLYQTAQ